ncbi:MAG: hypothetical protein ACYSTT_09645 [Planctomycetota bacterium]
MQKRKRYISLLFVYSGFRESQEEVYIYKPLTNKPETNIGKRPARTGVSAIGLE